tara:strand:+ start:1215 stop:1457 length:243 start_codon:yes stop_codon:yes gene_type:complete
MANNKNNANAFFKKLQKVEEIKKKNIVVDNFLTGGKGSLPNPNKMKGVEPMPNSIDNTNKNVKRKIENFEDLLNVKGIKK